MIAIFGIGDMRQIALIALGSIWPTLLNTLDGMRGVDTVKFDTAKALRLSGWRTYFSLVLPGRRTADRGRAAGKPDGGIILMVVSEMVAAAQASDIFILQAQAEFAIKKMWTGIIVLALIGTLLNYLFVLVERRDAALVLPVARARWIVRRNTHDYHQPRYRRSTPRSCSPSTACARSTTRAPNRPTWRSTPCHSASTRESSSASSGRAAPARRRCCAASPGSPRPAPERSRSKVGLLTRCPTSLDLVFQDYSRSLYPWFTNGRQRRASAARLEGMRKAERAARVSETLARVGLGHVEKKYPGSYPAECSSALRSPERSPTGRSCCSWTSRSRPSTPRRGSTSKI